MKVVLTLATLLIGTQTFASEVVCQTRGTLGPVEVRITSKDLKSLKDKIHITATGITTTEFELYPLPPQKRPLPKYESAPVDTNMSQLFSFARDALSDISGLVSNLPANEQRLIAVNLNLSIEGTFTNYAPAGPGKLTLRGDLSGTSPRLFEEYVLSDCKGQI